MFFSKKEDGSIAVDILDPHSHHLRDALSKLQSLVKYAETFGSVFRRIKAIKQIGDKLKALNLMDSNVRAEIMKSESAKNL